MPWWSLLYDADLDAWLFVEQFEPGVRRPFDDPGGEEDFSPWMVECVAGISTRAKIQCRWPREA
jgi:hypothetical protein